VAPVAGVTLVGVMPTHRRRGIMTSILQQLFADAREHGESVAALWASEGAIYRSSGFGSAARTLVINADASMGVLGETRGEVRVRLIDVATAHDTIREITDRVRPLTPGMYVRSDPWLDVFRLARHDADPKSPMYCVVVEIDGRDEGYALYWLEHHWPDDMPAGALQIRELTATGPDALRELWRYLSSIDLVTRVEWALPGPPVGGPLEWIVSEPRRLRVGLRDGMWLRLVDVEAGLAARGYLDDRPLVFELTDAKCPENAGRWHLAAGVAERTAVAAELSLDACDLGAVYLGGVQPTALVAAGRIAELVPGAAARADAIFASAVPPHCPQAF
jgi:predicted acetyltransferase